MHFQVAVCNARGEPLYVRYVIPDEEVNFLGVVKVKNIVFVSVEMNS